MNTAVSLKSVWINSGFYLFFAAAFYMCKDFLNVRFQYLLLCVNRATISVLP